MEEEEGSLEYPQYSKFAADPTRAGSAARIEHIAAYSPNR